MENDIVISFFLRFDTINKRKENPIYVRINMNNRYFRLSTGRFISASKWDPNIQGMPGTKEEAKILNVYLDTQRGIILKKYNQLLTSQGHVTLDELRNALLNRTANSHTLLRAFKSYIDRIESLIGIDYVKGTVNHYKTTYRDIKDFLQYQYKITDIDMKELDYEFITSFENYLKTQRHDGNNTTLKKITRLKTVINIAIGNKWINYNPFISFHGKVLDTNRTFLSRDELSRLEEKELPDRLSVIRDIFLFVCYTGFSDAEVRRLRVSDISIGIDGKKWIIVYRKKTNTREGIPLLDSALAIIDKYKEYAQINDEGKLFPIKSNQKMNDYLKVIASFCGITKNLSMHIGRHTFATTVTLSNGVPIESVSRMLGHTSLKTTQIYAKVIDVKVSDDMKQLQDRLNNNNKLKNASNDSNR